MNSNGGQWERLGGPNGVTRGGAGRVVAFVCCGGLLASVVAAGGCGRRRTLSPEEQVRDTVVAIERAFEAKDIKALRGLIADGYQDGEEHDRQEVLAFLHVLFRRHATIHLLTRVAAVELESPRVARATVVAAMASHPLRVVEDLPRLQADAYRFDLRLVGTEHGGWQVAGATWRPALPQDLFD